MITVSQQTEIFLYCGESNYMTMVCAFPLIVREKLIDSYHYQSTEKYAIFREAMIVN